MGTGSRETQAAAGNALWRAMLVVLLLGSIPLYVLSYTLVTRTGDFGFGIAEDYIPNDASTTWHVVSVKAGSSAGRTGLRSGDALPLANADRAMLSIPLAGDRARIQYRRNGRTGWVDIVATAAAPRRFSAADAIRALVESCVIGFALLVVFRAWHSEHAPLIASILCAYALNAATDNMPVIARAGLGAWLFVVDYTVANAVFCIATLLLFLLLKKLIKHGSTALLAVAGCAAAVTTVASLICVPLAAFHLLEGRATAFDGFVWDQLTNNVIKIITLAGLIVTYVCARGESRRRVAWIFWGFSPYYFGIALGAVLTSIPNLAAPLRIPALRNGLNVLVRSLELTLPISLYYGVLVRRTVDIGFVMSRVVVYASIAALLVSTFAFIAWGLSGSFIGSRTQTLIAFALVAAVTLLLSRAYERIVSTINRALFPTRQRRIDLIRSLQDGVESADSRSARETLTAEVCRRLSLSSAAVFEGSPDGGFIREQSVNWGSGTTWHLLPGDPIVSLLHHTRARTVRLDAELWDGAAAPAGPALPVLAIPVVPGSRIAAVALYGAHTDGTGVDPDEARSLANLCFAAAFAFDRHGNNATAT